MLPDHLKGEPRFEEIKTKGLKKEQRSTLGSYKKSSPCEIMNVVVGFVYSKILILQQKQEFVTNDTFHWLFLYYTTAKFRHTNCPNYGGGRGVRQVFRLFFVPGTLSNVSPNCIAGPVEDITE